MNKKFKNFIFDLDGTIIDSKEAVLGSICYALRKLGYREPDYEEIFWCVGPPLFDSFPILLQTDDKDLVQLAVDYYREIFLSEKIYENKLFDGIIPLLEELQNSGVGIFIATSKPLESAIKILHDLKIYDFFTGIYGASQDEKHCKKSNIIAHLLNSEKIETSESLMIGDRKFDIEGARDNKLVSCGVLYGFGSKDELVESGADYIVETTLELIKFL